MNMKLLVSLTAAIAASKIVQSISEVRLERVLGSVGLARKQNRTLEYLAFAAAGVILGTGVALLWAPKNGEETRALLGRQASRLGQESWKLARKAARLGQAATDVLEKREDEAHHSVSQSTANAMAANGEHS